MGLRLRSLSEDGVDVYTHIWSVVFFLLLAFILIVVPGNHTEIPGQENQSHPSATQYEATCWCPAQFEYSQVTYANAVCSITFNSQLQSKDIDSSQRKSPMDDYRYDFTRLRLEQESRKNNMVINKRTIQISPVVLFILAIALKLPQMLCSIMSRCCAFVNIEQTLESAEKADLSQYDDRRRMFSSLVKAFASYTGTNGKATAYLYLLMKVLIIIVLVAEIVVVTTYVLPNLQDPLLNQDNGSMANIQTSTSRPTPSSSNDTLLNPSQEPEQLQQHNEEIVISPIFHCFYQIRQLSNTHDYTLQCLMKPKSTQSETQDQTDNSAMTLHVFLMVLANLVFLLFVHIINTLVWLINLATDSTQNRLGLGKGSPLDLVFLIQMARSNLGIGVSAELVEALSHGESAKRDKEGHFLL